MLRERVKKNWKAPAFGALVVMALGLAVGFTIYEMRERGERVGVRVGERSHQATVEEPPGTTPQPAEKEQRCTDLGANCVCSEPLHMTDLVQVAGFSFNPNDSITKECFGFDNVQGGSVVANPISQAVIGADSSVLNALPSGHTLQRFLRGPEGHAGVYYIGHKRGGELYTKKMTSRFYVYHSPNYAWKGEGSCDNSKLIYMHQADGWPTVVDNSFGQMHMYGNNALKTWTWNGGANTVGDCCWIGPPHASITGAPGPTDWQGAWWRIELITNNLNGGPSPNGTIFQLYAKDITNDGPEIKAIDTSQSCAPRCGDTGVSTDWLNPPADDVTPGPSQRPLNAWFQSFYRQGGCPGFRATTHYMVAGWDTDTGQRIGCAPEVEGPTMCPTAGGI